MTAAWKLRHSGEALWSYLPAALAKAGIPTKEAEARLDQIVARLTRFLTRKEASEVRPGGGQRRSMQRPSQEIWGRPLPVGGGSRAPGRNPGARP